MAGIVVLAVLLVTPVAIPADAAPVSVLMVTANGNGTNDDRTVAADLEAAGLVVTIIDDNAVTATDAGNHDVVFITSTASQSAVNTKLTAVDTPLVNSEFLLHDDLGLTANGSANRNEQGGQNSIEIVDPAHPIVDNAFTGAVTVFTKFTRSTWGNPAAAADIIATLPGNPTRSTLFVYDEGATMANGDPAPARRAGVFLTAAADGNLLPAAVTLLANTLTWAASASPPPPPDNQAPTVDAGPDETTTATSVALAGSVGDDGLPTGSTVTATWSGPAGVSFADADDPTTTATLPGVGTYVLTLSASDTELNAVDTVTITVEDEPGPGPGPGPGVTGPIDVLMVTANANGSGDDQAIAADLTAAGFSVEIVNDNSVSLAEAEDADIVLISTTTAQNAVSNRLTPATTPIVNYEQLLQDDLGLTPNGSANRSESGGQKAIEIVDPGHPIIDDDYTGTVDVFTKFTRSTWGKPAAGADIVATIPGDPTRSTLYTYEAGATLADGSAAAARRANIFLSAAGDGNLTSVGLDLLVRTLNWSLLDLNGAPVVEAGDDIEFAVDGSALLSGSFTDDALPVGATRTIAWSGPPEITFAGPTTTSTTITATAPGTYEVTLTADDGFLTGQDTLTVTVTEGGGGGPAPLTFSTETMVDGDIPAPPPGSITEQTGVIPGDFDGDGVDEFVVYGRNGDNSVLWYRRSPTGVWQLDIIESDNLYTEAGATSGDVDGDGDLDVIIGSGRFGPEIWWWENPAPNFTNGVDWTRRQLLSTGEPKHHDLVFDDVDDDGQRELVYWTQGRANNRVFELWVAEVPADPTQPGDWSTTLIHDSDDDVEGLAITDVDLDGVRDIVGGGHWYDYDPVADTYTPIELTPNTATRVQVGQIIPGGRQEFLFSIGDQIGDLELVAWDGSQWTRTSLLEASGPLAAPWNRGHSLGLADLNGDGHLDIFTAEMYLPNVGDSAKANAREIILLGDGTGDFTLHSISQGADNHESKLVDVNGDGRLDIVNKPFDFNAPDLTVKINGGDPGPGELGNWTKHVIDTKPARAMFIIDADIDDDGDLDLVTGAWWYENTGAIDGWTRRTIGGSLGDALLVEDLDGDGDLDVFGARGPAGTAPNPRRFAWAENDGTGSFTVRTNITSGTSSFIQGVDSVRLSPTGPLEIWLSWNERSNLVQKLVVPTDPTSGTWPLQTANATSQGEQIEFADIDGDTDLDLMEGHIWLENTGPDSTTWPDHELHNPTNCCFAGVIDTLPLPDRVVVADMNADGRLDVVVSHEYDPNNRITWYEQPAGDPTQLWTEHEIGTAATAIHSLDVADLDGDGDLDVVAGEHRLTAEVIEEGDAWVFENLGAGLTWASHLIDGADAHHDGMQLADLDGDGDLDVYSIGWEHNRVIVYENRNGQGGPPPDPDTTAPVLSAIAASPSTTSATVSWTTDEPASSQVDVGTTPAYGQTVSTAPFVTNHALLVTGLSCGTTYHYQVTSADPSTNSASSTDDTFTTSPCGSDEVVNLALDEGSGTTATDSSGSNNDGTLIDGAGFEATTGDGSASAVRFDGVDDAIDLGPIDVAGDQITLAARFLADSFPGGVSDPRLISKATGTPSNDHVFMLGTFETSGEVRLRGRVRINGSTTTLIASSGALTTGTWYHATMTYDGTTMRLYLDGVEVGSTPLSGSIDTDPTVDVTVGRQGVGTPKGWDGLIDDVRIYARGLNGTEVAALAGTSPPPPPAPEDVVANVIDASRPHRAVFAIPGDLDGDGDADLAAGAWWYENPGDPTQAWTRNAIGGSLANVGAVHDFDGDGDLDLWGTDNDAPATPADASALYWAENDGTGSFTVRSNIAVPDGNFLQGVWVGRLTATGPLQLAVSWQDRTRGIQLFDIPADPTSGTWTWSVISTAGFGEDLDGGDIDDDGDVDLHLGEVWIQNDGTSSWPTHTVDASFPNAGPDRVEVGDVDGDGQLDAVVGVSRFDTPAEVFWFEAGADPTQPWARRTITSTAVGGAMSMDTVDFDGDGDLDVVVGEHGDEGSNPNLRLLLFLNNGDGTSWTEVVLDDSGSHHDGSQAVDLENDGDMDVVSTGWFHDRVTVYVNVSGPGAS
ncbi:MAG: FG-GAP-like repeat-containing protein [Actinomycetota bacterium]